MTSPHRSRFISTPSRRRKWRGIALGALAVTLSTALLAQDSIVTNASWKDEEWVHGQVGTVQCGETTGAFVTQSAGKALGGSLLSIDLDNVAEVEGVSTYNQAGSATSTGGIKIIELTDAWANPLDVGALSSVELGLTDFLELPLDTSTGVVNQFAQATGLGLAHGASGYVNDSGGIDLPGAEGDYPQLATLKLSEILDSDLLGGQNLGEALANVADLELEVGAVAARAELDTCASLWDTPSEQIARAVAEEAVAGLSREYMVASADLVFTSPTVGALVTAIGGDGNGDCTDRPVSVAYDLECTVNDFTGETGFLPQLLSAITEGLLGTITGGLGLGSISLDLAVSIDTNPVRALLSHTLDDGVVSINLANSEIRIDTTALLSSAYPADYTNGLNGLVPNTNPLADAQVLNTLNAHVNALLLQWLSTVKDVLDIAVGNVLVHLKVEIPLELKTRVQLLNIIDLGILDLGEIGLITLEVNCQQEAEPSGCTLNQLLDPETTEALTASFEPQSNLEDQIADKIAPELGLLSHLLGRLVSLVIEDILGGPVNAAIQLLSRTLEQIVGSLLGEAIEELHSNLSALTESVLSLGTPITSTVSNLYNGLFLDGVLDITFNAQNLTPAVDNEPPEWSKDPRGTYTVSAIRVGILDALGDFAVYLHLGRASVGPGCSVNNAYTECTDIPAISP